MNLPAYHRTGFDTWLPNIYDYFVKFAMLGKEKEIRKLFLKNIPANSKKILDLATGTGSVAIEIKKTFPNTDVFGADMSIKMMNIAKTKSKKENVDVHFMQQNIEKIDSTELKPETFDAVTISFGLHEMPHQSRLNVMKEAFRLLKQNGVFIIMDFYKSDSWCYWMLLNFHLTFFEPPYAKTIVYENITKELMEQGFSTLDKEECFGRAFQLIIARK